MTNTGIRTGTFQSILLNSPSFTVIVQYFPQEINLVVESSVAAASLNNPNSRSVLQNIIALIASGSLSTDSALQAVVNEFFGQSAAVLNSALDLMQPSSYSAFAELQMEVAGQIVGMFHQGLFQRCHRIRPRSFWVEPFGDWYREQGVDFQFGYTAQAKGISAGFDGRFADHWLLGVGGVYDWVNVRWYRPGSHAHVRNYYGTIYADYVTKRARIGATVMAGGDCYHVSRHIQFLATNETARSNPRGFEMVGQLMGNFAFPVSCSWSVCPAFSLDYFYLRTTAFTEKNAPGLNLHVNRHNNHTGRGEVGLAGQYSYTYEAMKSCLFLQFAGTWIIEGALHRPDYIVRFQNQSIPFKSRGWNRTLQLFSPSVEVQGTYLDFGASLQYKAEIGPRFFGQAANLRLDYRW